MTEQTINGWSDMDATRKIQALLNKAAGTDNDHEAEAFFAKAQEMMVRYAIDEARLREAQGEKVRLESPVKERFIFTYDAPGKMALISTICRNNRISILIIPSASRMAEDGSWLPLGKKNEDRRAIWMIGYQRDIDNAKLLYNSLLIQAMGSCRKAWAIEKALVDHQVKYLYGECEVCDREAKRSYNQRTGEYTYRHTGGQFAFTNSFLEGFAYTIGRRLSERIEQIKHEDPTGMALVSLDEKRVAEAVHEFFPVLGKGRATRSSSGGGFNSGSNAARNADIGNPGVRSSTTKMIKSN